MTKQSGLGANLYVAQYDLSGDTGSLGNVETSRALLDVTGIDKSAPEKVLGIKDGAIQFAGFWNTAAAQAHPVLSALPRTDKILTFAVGATVGSPAASMTAKQINYGNARGQDGSLTTTVDAHANGYGLEWSGGSTGDGLLTTGKQTFGTGTVDGTSIDLGAVSTLFGAAAYLHVFSIASGTAQFTVQDSANDIAFTDVAGMAFTPVTAATSERVQGAVGATVRRYVRIEGSGVHGAAVIVVNFIRYLTSSAA